MGLMLPVNSMRMKAPISQATKVKVVDCCYDPATIEPQPHLKPLIKAKLVALNPLAS